MELQISDAKRALGYGRRNKDKADGGATPTDDDEGVRDAELNGGVREFGGAKDRWSCKFVVRREQSTNCLVAGSDKRAGSGSQGSHASVHVDAFTPKSGTNLTKFSFDGEI